MQVKVILKFEGNSTGLTNLEKKNLCWKSANKKSINYQIKFALKIYFFT